MESKIWNEVSPFKKVGAPNKRFETPEQLWNESCQYFEWALNTPWMENRAVKMKNDEIEAIHHYKVPKARYLSSVGLCVYLNIQRCTYNDYQRGKRNTEEHDFAAVCNIIDAIMYEQKLSGAASGMFHPMIVARELGLGEVEDSEEAKPIPTAITIAVRDCSVNKDNDED